MTTPKLTKDQIQKLALCAVGFVALLYAYFSFFLGPLNRTRANMQQTITSLQEKLASSKGELSRAASLETEATTATTRYAALQALSPEGAPIAWFPPKMKAFFANQEIDKATARLDPAGVAVPYKQPELADWAKYTWVIDLPVADFAVAGRAIAELENTEPLLAVSKLSIKDGGENAEFQQIVLTANTAIMKR
jgi:hypothetical protein